MQMLLSQRSTLAIICVKLREATRETCLRIKAHFDGHVCLLIFEATLPLPPLPTTTQQSSENLVCWSAKSIWLLHITPPPSLPTNTHTAPQITAQSPGEEHAWPAGPLG